MKMNQRSRGGLYEQGERTSFGSPRRSPEVNWRGPEERSDGLGRNEETQRLKSLVADLSSPLV